jgi:hypothetical protein
VTEFSVVLVVIEVVIVAEVDVWIEVFSEPLEPNWLRNMK